MTQILRVVWKDTKEGLYDGRCKTRAGCPEFPLRWLAHPCPLQDAALLPQWKKLLFKSNYSFGFADEEQFKRWVNYADTREVFNDWLDLEVWTVGDKHARIGDHQAVFNKRYARNVDTLDLVSFD